MSLTIGVYGASGFGREVMPIVVATAPAAAKTVFIDDSATGEINGYPIISFASFVALQGEKQVTIAVANSLIREKLARLCESENLSSFAIRAENTVFGDFIDVGIGSIFCAFTMLTSNVKIGSYFHSNIYSYVAHDCVIGDFVTFAPNVSCNGNVHIDDHAYIGTGAILRQGSRDKPLRIGRGAVVGMGAVVTKDVPPGVTVVGNPARPFVKG